MNEARSARVAATATIRRAVDEGERGDNAGDLRRKRIPNAHMNHGPG